MSYEELGAALRAEREKKNLTIEDVANDLKINPRQLKALENGDVDALPHPAYARGFLRSYAALLGMDNEETRSLIQGLGPVGLQPEKRSEVRDAASRRSGIWLWLVLILLLAGAVWMLWRNGFFDRWLGRDSGTTVVTSSLPTADEFMASRDAEPRPAPEGSASQETRPVPFSPASSRPVIVPPPAPEAPEAPAPEAPEAAAANDAGAPAEPETPAVAAPESANAATEAPGTAAPEQPAQPEQHRLIITAIEECWVHSNADKTDTRQFSLRQGDTFALTFSDTLELRLGNAGGVRLRYDGRDLPPPGTSGQVRNISFPPKED